VPAGVELAVCENELPPWNEVAVSDEELLRTKFGGGGMAEEAISLMRGW